MGRGRQKAKQMKVARRLKYFSPETDLGALQRELSGKSEDDQDQVEIEVEEDEEYVIPPAIDDWDEDDWSSGSR